MLYRLAHKIWNTTKWVWITLIFAFMISLASNLVVAQQTDLSKSILVSILHWFARLGLLQTLILSILGMFLAITLLSLAYTIWEDHAKIARQSSVPKLNGQNRLRMLNKVQSRWIVGLLEKSLHDRALIALRLHEQPDAVANPWGLVLQQSDQPERLLPSGTNITQVYDAAGGELLILGSPGSGKTTLLLDLARNLIKRARIDSEHPMPVVFNLSSWAMKRQPIIHWLIDELSTKYQVPGLIGQAWVESDQILPLLDGLDEVATEYRTACIEAINNYRREHLVPIVVCSRSADYRSLLARLLLQSAVEVQPLTNEQIDSYLASAGEQLAAVHQVVNNDPILQEMVTTPLMLDVLTLAYQNSIIDDQLKVGSLEMRRRRVFAAYVHRMLHRRSIEIEYRPEQTIQWLSWLAQQMAHNDQTEFYIERMQPDLLTGWTYRIYQNIFTWPLSILLGGLIGLSSGFSGTLVFGTIFGLNSGLLGGIVGGLAGGYAGYSSSILVHENRLKNRLKLGLIGGLVGVIIGWLVSGLYGGLGGAIVAGSFAGLTRRIGVVIEPAEVVSWSWVNMWQGLVKSNALKLGMVGGMVGGTILGVVRGLKIGLVNGPVNGFLNGLVTFLAIVLLACFYFIISEALEDGFLGEMLEEETIAVPNEGIWRSARNSIFVGSVFGLIIGLLFGILSMLFFGLTFGIIFGSVAVLIYGIFEVLLSGGLTCLQHVVLRLILWRAGYIPRNYIRFLDYAADHILIRKVGGGYIFIHRLIQDYFASLESSSTPENIAGQTLKADTFNL